MSHLSLMLAAAWILCFTRQKRKAAGRTGGFASSDSPLLLESLKAHLSFGTNRAGELWRGSLQSFQLTEEQK